MTLDIAWATVVGMVEPPAAPTTSSTFPAASKTIVGAIEESGTLPGAGAFAPVPTTPK